MHNCKWRRIGILAVEELGCWNAVWSALSTISEARLLGSPLGRVPIYFFRVGCARWDRPLFFSY